MQTTEVKIRVPNDTHETLKRIAAEEGRSMTKQITYVLKEYIRKQPVKN